MQKGNNKMKTTYEEFIDDNAMELASEIRQFEALDVKAILENNVDLAKALRDIDAIYDAGMCDYFERALCGTATLSIISLSKRALDNLNKHGTEMFEALNALHNFNQSLREYSTDDEELFEDEDMEGAFE